MLAIRHVALAAVVVCLMASVTFGDYISDFEAPDYNGSAAGVQLTDWLGGGAAAQQGWYVPSVSDDYYVYTYAGNPFGMTAGNPTGGEQFAAGPTVGNITNYARGQHDEAAALGKPVLYGFDFNAKCLLPDPTLAPFTNIGSFSLQPSAANLNMLMHRRGVEAGSEDPVNDPGVNYTLSYLGIQNAAGVGLGNQYISATLLEDHWYRNEVIVDFDTNRVTKATLIDLDTMAEIVVLTPADWYLAGGATRPPENSLPTAVRMFSVGNANNPPTNNEMMAFDNLVVQAIPEPATLCLLGALSVVSALRRRRRVA